MGRISAFWSSGLVWWESTYLRVKATWEEL